VCENCVEVYAGGKCSEVPYFRTVILGIFTVIFVLFTDLVNNKVLPAVIKLRK